mmetsp:Transcript_2356/g.5416  ORF Transcript_2356/g.5416 Transcript_2356/m.5416 type:complete len:931 (+) Transcript_2356:71-2863(+)
MGCCGKKNAEEDAPVEKVVAKQVSPASDRRCTDICCLPVYVLAWIVYIIVTVAGVQDGQPSKLFKPRDFQGAYCGIERQWNNGPNLNGKDKQTYAMNVSAVVDQIVNQLLCSTATADFLQGSQSPLTIEEQNEYACACCLGPCKTTTCTGSKDLGKGGDITDPAFLKDIVTKRLQELTTFESSSFFDPSGFNGDFASQLWSEATKYFVPVCLPSCNPGSSVNTSSRMYYYAPSADSPLRKAWDELNKSTSPAARDMQDAIESKFSFKAMPEHVCPYDAAYCVPFPGVDFHELAADYCAFEMTAQVKDAVGDAAASVFESLGANAFSETSVETLGTWMGDFEQSIDAFVLTCFICFAVGLVFVLLLRFCVGPCVWTSIFLVLLLFLVGGGIVWVRSGQCADAGLFDTGRQIVVAVTVAGTNAVENAVDAVTNSNDPKPSEELSGDGANYVGVQTRTINGYLCQDWRDAGPQYYPVLKEQGHLRENFCRNPYNETSAFKGSTIWCFTTDKEKKWEICRPVGVIQPECKNGHAVEGQTARDFLKAGAIILWSLSLVWILIVCCFCSRIQLAIKLNQVASQFLSHTPQVLLIPVVQALVSVCWSLIWAYSACFLLSQVPDGYTEKEAYASYSEAYGTEDKAGKCTGKWPTGFVWKDETCTLEDPRCWRCAPPRYTFDARFVISFFVYLWNNAFLIALGQCAIAGAVGVWFFTPNEKKGWLEPVSRSVYNCFRFHTGSLAFGAFILAVVQLIRYLLMYFEEQAKAQKNKVMALILRCMRYAIWCLERFIRFLNKNAYIQVALRGTNFCTSAKKSWEIITANMLRFGTVAVLGRVINRIGILFIITGTTVAGYFVLKAMHPSISPIVPIILYIITSYILGKLFMSVFGMAVDTCLQCVIAAEAMAHDGSFVPQKLKSVLRPKEAWQGDSDGKEGDS